MENWGTSICPKIKTSYFLRVMYIEGLNRKRSGFRFRGRLFEGSAYSRGAEINGSKVYVHNKISRLGPTAIFFISRGFLFARGVCVFLDTILKKHFGEVFRRKSK